MGSSRGYILPAGLGCNCWVCRKNVCVVLRVLDCLICIRFERASVCICTESGIIALLYIVYIQAQGVHPHPTYTSAGMIFYIPYLYYTCTPHLCCTVLILYTLCWVGVRGRVLTLLEKYHTNRANIWDRGLSRILALLEIGWTEFLLAKKWTELYKYIWYRGRIF